MQLPIKTSDDRLCIELARDERLKLLLDLDGTLIPFAPRAETAVLDRAAIDLVDSIRRTGIEVAIVSGRAKRYVDPLRERLSGLSWLAEHGAWTCDETGIWRGPDPISEIPELTAMLEPYTRIPGVHVEPKSRSVCLHYREVPAELKADMFQRAELSCNEWLEAKPEFELLRGVEMLEVRHRTVNTGLAVAWMRSRFPSARIIAIGDDDTDDDMFAALGHDDLAICVGQHRARARCWLPGPAGVRAFLIWLRECRLDRSADLPAPLECRPRSIPNRTQLLVVSNRTPTLTQGRERPVGGLVSALEPALRAHAGMWLGWSGGESDGDRPLILHDDAVPLRASFEFPTGWKDRFYGGFCNRALWPLFHGFLERTTYSDPDWQTYVAANDEFARRADEVVAPDGTVWIHDYHLLLVGRALRRRMFCGKLGLFLHIPFPQRDLLETLPWAADLLEAMLAFDFIGFHTERWADNFRACARAWMPSSGLPNIGVLPIGVDPQTFRADGARLDSDLAGLAAALGDRRLILGVDRLDYAKGIPERLVAYERLLELEPSWHKRIAFVQISVPSRADVPEYSELRQRVENLVGRINGRFGEADWVPVRYLYRSYDHHVLGQLYRMAAIALVTPLRDGLNLVAKEFVVAQNAEDPGVLVLSRFAGAASELTGAVLTNPFHRDGLARDLDRALRMDADERRRRHIMLTAALEGRTPETWAKSFLDRLASAR